MTRCRLVVVGLVVALGGCTDRGPTLPPINAAAGGGGPSVTVADPNNAPQDTTMDVRVLGSGFDKGSRAEWAIAGVPSSKVHTNSTRFVSSKELVANITIALDAEPVLYDILVTTGGGKKGIGTELFAVRTKGAAVGQQMPDPEVSFTRGFGIWVMNAEGTKLFEVAPDGWAGGAWPTSSWAPNGTGTISDPYRLAFAADRARSGTAWPIGIVDLDTLGAVVTGRNLRILMTSEPAVHFAWSPLGDSLAVADGAPEGSFPSDLHLIAPDGSGEHTIYSAPDSELVRWPAWSADGRYVAWIEQPKIGDGYASDGDAIKALDLFTRTVTVIYQMPVGGMAREVSWARTRLAIAYSHSVSCPRGRKDCENGIRLLELDASLHPIGSHLFIAAGESPSWAPDDRALVFSDGVIHRYDFATGRIANLESGSKPDWRR